MPLKLTVQIPSGSGKVTGTVSTPGQCDINPAVLANKPVTIKSFDGTIWNLTTDTQGVYSQWIDVAQSPVTITANLSGYQPGIFTNVAGAVGGGSVTKDFSLRTLLPCFAVAPPTLAVTLTLGQNTSRPVKVNNSGAASGTFTTTESSPESFPVCRLTTRSAARQCPACSHWPARRLRKSRPVRSGRRQPGARRRLSREWHWPDRRWGLIWLNRFTPTASYPFSLEKVSLIFDTYTPVGSAMQLICQCSRTADGNPADGDAQELTETATMLTDNDNLERIYPDHAGAAKRPER